MKSLCLLLMAALSVGIFAETVVKFSSPFAFPTAVGVATGHPLQDGAASFVCKSDRNFYFSRIFRILT
jgi:hypothetical protein